MVKSLSIMEYTTASRGKPKLTLDGYIYLKNKDINGSTYWRCERRGECKVTLITFTDSGRVKAQPAQHAHAPDVPRVKAVKAVAEMKERAVASDDVTSLVINNCSANLSLVAAAALPSKSTLSRMIQRKRKAPDEDGLPNGVFTTRGEDFLLAEDQELDIIVLATEGNLRLLSQYHHWFCDGTFDSAPVGHQLYTIHAHIQAGHTIPLVYCITRNKNEMVYRRILQILKEHKPDLEPQSVMMDFEMAAINAFTLEFPHATLTGCLFHFGQCIYRKVQELGLQQRYRDDDEFALIIKKFQGLAFVPADDVIAVYDELVNSLDEDLANEVLERFLIYFETTWIGPEHRGRRRRPLFDIKLWNVRGRVEDDLPRTNNSVEGWHRAFDQRINVTHPSKSKLVKKLVLEQSGHEVTLEQFRATATLPRQKVKYRQVTARLNTIMDTYFDVPNDDYLRGIALNL